jgi:hypothetical protein
LPRRCIAFFRRRIDTIAVRIAVDRRRLIDEQFADRHRTVVDPHVETPVDEANTGEQQVVLDRAWDRFDLQAHLVVRFETQHDPQQQERCRCRPCLGRTRRWKWNRSLDIEAVEAAEQLR